MNRLQLFISTIAVAVRDSLPPGDENFRKESSRRFSGSLGKIPGAMNPLKMT
jgi:hypothetical protein